MHREIHRGEIYWIIHNQYKQLGEHVQRAGRPGIVVSSDHLNVRIPTLEIVYLTTQPKVESPMHCTIETSNKPSTVLCEQIQTISKEQVGTYIGKCTTHEMQEIDACLAMSLQLDVSTMENQEPETTYIPPNKTMEESYKKKYDGLLEKYTELQEKYIRLIENMGK